MEELQDRFPEGVEYAIVYDTTPFIHESIDEVFKTLRDAVILVAIVMLVFLQIVAGGDHSAGRRAGRHRRHVRGDGRARLLGEQPDAVRPGPRGRHRGGRRHRRRRGGRSTTSRTGSSPRDATMLAMDQVAGPVIAVGLVLAAVFVPCVFISGIVGEFFRQFAVTIAI